MKFAATAKYTGAGTIRWEPATVRIMNSVPIVCYTAQTTIRTAVQSRRSMNLKRRPIKLRSCPALRSDR